MSPLQRLWFWALVVVVAAVALIQVWAAWRWVGSPWPGFSVLAQGEVQARRPAEAPEALRPLLLEASPLELKAVLVRGRWHLVSVVGDLPRKPHERLEAALEGLEPGTEVRLRVEGPGGRLTEVPAKPARVPRELVVEESVRLVVGLALVAFGLWVFHCRPNAADARSFLGMSLALGGSLITAQVVGGFRTHFDVPALALRYGFLAAGPVLWLNIIRPDRLKLRPWLTAIPWLLAIAAVFAAILLGEFENQSNVIIRGGRLAMWFFAGIYLLQARFTARSRQEARRLEFYLTGFVLPFMLPAFYQSVAPSDAAVPPWIMLTLLACPAVLGYGILKHRLFDMEVVIRRGLAYSAFMAVAALVYGGLVAAAGALFGGSEAARSPIWTAGFVLVAVFAGSALKPRLQQLVDRGVNPERFRHLEALRVAGGELAALEDEQEVADSLVRVTTGAAGLQSAALFLERDAGFVLTAKAGALAEQSGTVLERDSPLVSLVKLVSSEIHRKDFEDNPKLAPLREGCLKRMDEVGVELLIPLSAGRDELMGLLGLGPRRDDRPLNSEDMDLLKTLTHQASFAIARARVRRGAAGVRQVEPAGPQALGPGVELGHFRIDAAVGKGGMGTVYRAVDQRLERTVALKFLSRGRADDEQMLARLRREARVLATLSHPSIMQINTLEEHGGHTFLVMEYLGGPTLGRELKDRGRFPAEEVAAVGGTVAGALGYALKRGVIHRDIKLQNLMRSETGEVKLTDFGLAKPLEGEQSLTGTGRIVGTPVYLAPELLKGQAASFRSDMYALGVVLRKLLGGHRASKTDRSPGRTPSFQPVAAEDLLGEGVAEPLVAVLVRLHHHDPEQRYSSYDELVEALDQARERL